MKPEENRQDTGKASLFVRQMENWNQRAEEFGRRQDSPKRLAQIEFFLAYLTEHYLLTVPSKALDVGCGTGDYARALAGRGCQVTGVDLSPSMLRYARMSEMEQTEFLQLAWQTGVAAEQGWQRKFDLVYAILCPGICSAESMAELCLASQKSCLWVSFSHRENRILAELQSYFGLRERNWQAQLEQGMEWLRAEGYVVHRNRQTVEMENVLELEAAVEYFSHRLYQNLEMSLEAIQVEIRPMLLRHAGYGELTHFSRDQLAWVHWQVGC